MPPHCPDFFFLSLLRSFCCSIVQLCPTLWDPVDCSMPGFPILPEFAQTHVHWVSEAIQPSHPLSPPSPSVVNLPQHQGLFQWVGSSHQVAEVGELQLQHQSFQWIFRVDCWEVGCFLFLFLLGRVNSSFESESKVALSCPTLWDPMDCTCMGFSREEYWSGLPSPSPGDLPDPGIEPRSPALQSDALPSEPPGNPISSTQILQWAVQRAYFLCTTNKLPCPRGPSLGHERLLANNFVVSFSKMVNTGKFISKV